MKQRYALYVFLYSYEFVIWPDCFRYWLNNVLVVFAPNLALCHWHAALLPCLVPYWWLTPSIYVHTGIFFRRSVPGRCGSPFCKHKATSLSRSMHPSRWLSISKQKSLPPFVFLEAIRHIRHFLIDKVFEKKHLYPLAIIHMEHINVLDFDDKSERNLRFSFGNLGIVFNGASAQLFPPREKW